MNLSLSDMLGSNTLMAARKVTIRVAIARRMSRWIQTISFWGPCNTDHTCSDATVYVVVTANKHIRTYQ